MKKKLLLGTFVLATALAPLSAYAENGAQFGGKIGNTYSTSVKVQPGIESENEIGFAGSVPPKEILTQMIEQVKKNVDKTGSQTLVVKYVPQMGQEEKLTVSLDDSTGNIITKIQKKFKDARPLSATAAPVGKQEINGSAASSITSVSVKVQPGTEPENAIGFTGSVPPKEILTQMIEQAKKNVDKTGSQTLVVKYVPQTGQEEKLTVSLDDSTGNIIAKIQDKFKDAKPLSATVAS
ncbi:hypothetical protein [Lysinibacillus xylanilyticus]|uniref:hypothetical protein n=1 Tax=Lysinibacillus xylanilyticus TaxID=582475 RepID=UPI00083C959E|nr:hypothetical protein [Lysinibacillus xylanilyticus]